MGGHRTPFLSDKQARCHDLLLVLFTVPDSGATAQQKGRAPKWSGSCIPRCLLPRSYYLQRAIATASQATPCTVARPERGEPIYHP
eukprot:9487600-Pyramimonas_sp.AAC.1